MKQKIQFKGRTLMFSVTLISCIMLFNINVFAVQPQSSYWYPKQLLEWNPSNDKDAKYNIGSIPLAKRFVSDKMNKNASSNPKVIALSIMNPSTSGTPSQGSNKFDTYTFSYWQYIDTLVYWGGSAGEGLIVSPSADVIDSAHKNGVTVLGTIFMPPYAYGGKDEWVKDLLVKDHKGNFPVADKLIQVAKYYGFDGWFINEETGSRFLDDKRTITEEDAKLMREFLRYLQDKKPSQMQIIWYDAMDKDGYVGWQNMLNDLNKPMLGTSDNKLSDGMFLNFWWTNEGWYLRDKKTIYYTDGTELKKSGELAKQIGRSPYELYAGVDVQSDGYNTEVDWNRLFPNNNGENAYTSLGLYCPSWTFYSSGTVDEYLSKESRFWTSESGDPRVADASSPWKGISNYVVEKSSVNSLPFCTCFNMGNGKFYAVNGDIVKNSPWNNRSLQDIMPTWRWIIDNDGNTLKPSIDFDSAYYGGTSLKVTGDLKANNESLLKLYKTDIKIEPNTKLALIYKVNNSDSNMKVALTFDGDSRIYYADVDKANGDGWNTKKLSLGKYIGKKLTSISLAFKSEHDISNFTANIGQLILNNSNEGAAVLSAVSNIKIEDTDFREGIYTDVRLNWNKLDSSIQQYEIYRVKPNGSREFLGATPNNSYYVQEMRRIDKEKATTLEIVPVDKNYSRGEAADVLFNWPAYPKPIANFTSDKTLIAPSESVKFVSTSSEVTESLKWKFDGAVIVTSTEKEPIVTYEKEGTYKVSLIAKNSSGESEAVKEGYITVSKDAIGGLKNLSLNKRVFADSFTNDNEKPDFAVDNNEKTKWCAVGDVAHQLTIDLDSPHMISQFIIKHAEAGGESAAFNTRAYRIQLSSDNKNWADAVTVNDNSAAVSMHAVPVTTARYVRLIIDKATQGGDTAARIYDFEVLGL